MLVLAVEIDEHAGQFAQGRTRRERAVDERAAASLCGDLAAQEDLAAVGRFEDGLECRCILAGPDQVGRGAPADEQPDGSHQNRLARPRLAGEHIEAGLELELQAVDDRQMADRKEPQHGLGCRSSRPKPVD